MQATIARHEIRIDPEGNPLLEGGYAPIDREYAGASLTALAGEIPTDLAGAYVRNGPNPRFQPRGRYHLFDGDGMLHAVRFAAGAAHYSNKWIRTAGFEMEGAAGKALWPGLLEMPDRSMPKAWGSHHWLKDASNTDVVPFQGKLLTTFYQCGVPYILDAATLETVGPLDVEQLGMRQVSAHSRTDLATGEFMFFDYDAAPPFMTYGVIGADGAIKTFTEIDLPGARLPHDMAITPRYSILMDLPLFWDPKLLARDIHKVTFYHDLPARFAVLPRHGGPVRWFEAEPCYIYHVINAWEEGEALVLDVCRMRSPEPDPAKIGTGPYANLIAWANMDAQFWRYRFDLATGSVREGPVDDRFIEFPTINQYRQGLPNAHAYAAIIPQGEPLRMGGLAAYDLRSGTCGEYLYGPGVYASEPVFAPRINAIDETDGYLMTFVEDMNRGGASELHLFDPSELARGPIARIGLPQRMPMGFHACWSPT